MNDNRWIKRRPASKLSDTDVEAQLLAVHEGFVLYRARWPNNRAQKRPDGQFVYTTGIFRMPWRYWAQRYAGAVR